MSQEDDVMSIIHLLAAAAEAGAKGVLSQAAFNLMKATEAKQKALTIKNNPDFLIRATALVEETKRVFIELANDKASLDEGKQDIILFNISAENIDSKLTKTIN